jgi:hypothetical protein
MKNFLFTIFASFVLLSSQSCGKDSDEFIPLNTTTIVKGDTVWQADLLTLNTLSTNVLAPLNIEKLMAELAIAPTEHEINAENGGIIRPPNNAYILDFPPRSCVTQNNRPCTGSLKVEVLVLRRKGEFLLNNVPTVSLGKQLISGGAVQIKVTQNGEEVKLARDISCRIKFQAAAAPDEAMKLFEGKTIGRFQFDWIPLSTTIPNAPTIRPWADTAQQGSGYDLFLDRFSWINCDKFSGDSTSLTNKFCVALPDTFTNLNTSVFAVFKDINSVVSLAGIGSTKQFCVPSNYRGLPIGKVINIISISTIKDRIYVGKKEVTITANSVQTVVPTLTTKAAAKELITNL